MPQPAKYAVIFVSQRTAEDPEGYDAMAEQMESLARRQEGFVEFHSVRDSSGKGISISYWSSDKAIRQWATHAEHLEAQKMGRQRWYDSFEISVANIDRCTDFRKSSPWCESEPDPG